jgi:hypothetical protein
MLWEDTKAPEASKKEALEVLRKEAELQGDKTDAVTLQMLGAGEAFAQNKDGWTKAYETLVQKFPADAGVMTWKAWLAYLYLQSDKDAEAQKLVEGMTLPAAGPVGAYSLAWVKFRQRDFAGAQQAIAFAVENWPGGFSGALKRDFLLMHSRGGAPVAAVDAILQKVAPAARRDVLFELCDGYRFAGYYDRALETLELLMNKDAGGDGPSPQQRVQYRFRQSDFAARLDQPDRATGFAIEAHQGLKSCDTCEKKLANAVTENLNNLAVFYHNTYHTTRDPKYYEPAVKLYRYMVEIGGDRVTETKTNLESLEDTFKQAGTQPGRHDKRTLGNMLLLRREVPIACYESLLLSEPTIEGTVKLELAISDKGMVTESSTNPAAGSNGMAGVGACLLDRVKTWTFPGQSSTGMSKLSVTYQFKQRAARQVKAKN